MKILILAAGSGSRMSAQFKGSKPLIYQKGKPLIWWAVQSFHELLTFGLVEKKDFKIVIRKDQENEFRSNLDIKNYFQYIDPFIVIPELTSGPAETAKLSLNILLSESETILSETLIISDSDHYVKSIEIVRNLQRGGDIFLWETPKDDSLAWCFLNRKADPIKLIEKPENNLNIDIHKGVIGVYGFKSIEIFLHEVNLSSEEKVISEFFISTVINRLITKGKILSSSIVYEFYPMGTLDQINNLDNLPLSEYIILDSATRFVDIDGVVLYHNATIHGTKSSDIGSDKPLIENIYKINNEYLRSIIILTTSRPEIHRAQLEKTLKEFGINYDQIIMNCSGGVRYLYNDFKPNREFIRTANSVNLLRNSSLVFESNESVVEDISGGSQAKTLLFKGEKKFVKKIAYNEQSVNIIKYQEKWFEFAKKINLNVPEVLELRLENKEFCWLKSDYINNLENFSTFLEKEPSKYKYYEMLKNELNKLYSQVRKSGDSGSYLLREIVDKKVLPSLKKSFNCHTNNPATLDKLIKLMAGIQEFCDSKAADRFKCQGLIAPIHGDLTFENLQIQKNTNLIYMLDPIGKMIEPNYNRSSFEIFSYPVFDLARLELSYQFNYEQAGIFCKTQSDLGVFELEELPLQLDNSGSSITETVIGEAYKEFYTKNLPIVVVLTLGRILKYKSNALEVQYLANCALKILGNIKN